METLARTLAMLQPDELYPLWRYIDLMEQCGEADAEEAKRWKNGIFGLMLRWGLEPADLIPKYEQHERSDLQDLAHSRPGEAIATDCLDSKI